MYEIHDRCLLVDYASDSLRSGPSD